MKTLIDIWGKLQPGDKVLFQHCNDKGDYSNPQLAIIVGLDIWDQAVAVHFVDYKDFHVFYLKEWREPKVRDFGEWMEYWNVLGHWHMMPKFKNLLKAYRKAKPYGKN